MKRQIAIVVAGSVALGLGAAIVGLSSKLRTEQSTLRQHKGDALAEQRRAANAADLAPKTAGSPAHRQLLCVRGVDTFASTANAGSVLDSKGRLDPDALGWVSRQAARAERRAEVAHAGPALPQRLGRTKKHGEWTRIEPPTRTCKDTTAYAALSVDAQRPSASPAGEK